MRKLQKDQKGFTIIEVLIVLAIAGLIMLIVFLAVPALQRNQRNTARNTEASRVSTAVNECLSNRNGVTTSCDQGDELPPTDRREIETLSPSAPTAAIAATAADPAFTVNTATIRFGRVCNPDGSSSTQTGATARSYVVLYQLENNTNRCIGSNG